MIELREFDLEKKGWDEKEGVKKLHYYRRTKIK